MGKCKDLQKKKSKHRGQNPCVQNRGPPCLRQAKKAAKKFGEEEEPQKDAARQLQGNFNNLPRDEDNENIVRTAKKVN